MKLPAVRRAASPSTSIVISPRLVFITTVALPCRQAASASAQPRVTAARGEGLQLTTRGKNSREKENETPHGSETFEVDTEETSQFSTVLFQL